MQDEEQTAEPTKPTELIDTEDRRIVRLPTGRLVRIRKGAGRDLKRAHLLAGQKGTPLDVLVCLMHIKCEFAVGDIEQHAGLQWERQQVEWFDDIEDVDLGVLFNAVQRPAGKFSSPSTSQP